MDVSSTGKIVESGEQRLDRERMKGTFLR